MQATHPCSRLLRAILSDHSGALPHAAGDGFQHDSIRVTGTILRLMEIIYLLIPISLILLGGIVWILLWAVRNGQYDDLEGPAHRILMDEDKIVDEQKNSRRGGAG